MDSLENLYQKAGYPGLDRFWSLLPKGKYKKKEVADWLAQQKVAQLHHRPARTVSTPIASPNYGHAFQMDLLDVTPYSRSNGGTKWIFLMIDIFSRKIAAAPMRNKEASSALVALKECIEDIGIMPKIMESDKGSEWKDVVAKYFQNNDILVKQAEVGDHNFLGIIDSASRLVKNWIHKHITYKQNERFVDDLPVFIKAYNDTVHSSLGDMSPNEAIRYPHELQRYRYAIAMAKLIKRRKRGKQIGVTSKFKVGDHVRVLKLKTQFQKGYHVKYSLSVHKITAIEGLYSVLEDGKRYRADRLLKVPEPKASVVEPVRDVAKQARSNRRRDVLLNADGIVPENVVRRSNRERRPTYQVVDENGDVVIF